MNIVRDFIRVWTYPYPEMHLNASMKHIVSGMGIHFLSALCAYFIVMTLEVWAFYSVLYILLFALLTIAYGFICCKSFVERHVHCVSISWSSLFQHTMVWHYMLSFCLSFCAVTFLLCTLRDIMFGGQFEDDDDYYDEL